MLSVLDRFFSVLQHINANKIVLRDHKTTYTGVELLNRAATIANFFSLQGAKIDDRIAIQLTDRMEFALCYFAAMIGGYTIVPLNLSLPKNDLSYILEITKPVIVVKTLADIKLIVKTWYGKIHSDLNSVSNIFFTSGTTNKPKGVCHSIKNMLNNVDIFNKFTGINEHTCLYHVMPISYMAGFLNTILSPILAGGSVVLGSQFDAKNVMYFWKLAMRCGVNAVWITPTMADLLARLNRNSDVSEWTKTDLRHVFVGTAPLPQATKDLFEKTFYVECLESYGMTEVLLVAANTKKFPRKKSSVGYLLNAVDMEARDATQNKCLQGQEGSLHIRTPFSLLGYLDPNTGKIISSLEDEWFATGDYGFIDDENNIFITGRIKDIIIHGGTNVSPRAVEEVLLQHPDVNDVAVVGKIHPFC